VPPYLGVPGVGAVDVNVGVVRKVVVAGETGVGFVVLALVELATAGVVAPGAVVVGLVVEGVPVLQAEIAKETINKTIRGIKNLFILLPPYSIEVIQLYRAP
jgi:hypothetical protein